MPIKKKKVTESVTFSKADIIALIHSAIGEKGYTISWKVNSMGELEEVYCWKDSNAN